MTKNPSERLGYKKQGEDEIKTHSFFKKINWKTMEKREAQPPFKPKIVSIFSHISKLHYHGFINLFGF